MSNEKKYLTVYQKATPLMTQVSQYLIFIVGLIIAEASILGLITQHSLLIQMGWAVNETTNWITIIFLIGSLAVTGMFGWRMSDTAGDKGTARRILGYSALQVSSLLPLLYALIFFGYGSPELAISSLLISAIIGTSDSLIIIYFELVKEKGALGGI